MTAHPSAGTGAVPVEVLVGPPAVAATDAGTGVLTGAARNARATAVLGCAESGWSLLLVGLDRSAALDATCGYPAADHVLARVAAVLGATVPDGVVGRFGDEFVVLAPGGGAEPGRHAEAVRTAVARLDVTVDGPARPVRVAGVTASIGVATRASGPVSPAALARMLWAADRALYAAKQAGGDTVRTDPDGGHDVGTEIP